LKILLCKYDRFSAFPLPVWDFVFPGLLNHLLSIFQLRKRYCPCLLPCSRACEFRS
jgi:hypothetical protein